MNKYQDKKRISNYLQQYKWEAMLSKETIETIQLIEFEPGEYLIRGGDMLEWFFLYVEGRSKVFKLLENGQAMLVRFYKPFQVMGDVELFQESPCISSVQALTSVICLGIPMTRMREEAENNIPLMKYFCESLAWKLTSFNITSAINQNYSLEARLAGYLSVIYRAGEENDKEGLETENMGDMAELLGCSYRHLTRVIKDFKDEGLIDKQRRQLKILHPEKLRELAGDLYV